MNRSIPEFEELFPRISGRVLTRFHKIVSDCRPFQYASESWCRDLFHVTKNQHLGVALANTFRPLAIIPVLSGDRVIMHNAAGIPIEHVNGLISHFEASWGISYPR